MRQTAENYYLFVLTPSTWNIKRHLGCMCSSGLWTGQAVKPNRVLLVIFILPLLSPCASITALLFYSPPCTVCTDHTTDAQRSTAPTGQGAHQCSVLILLSQRKIHFVSWKLLIFQICDSDSLTNNRGNRDNTHLRLISFKDSINNSFCCYRKTKKQRNTILKALFKGSLLWPVVHWKGIVLAFIVYDS